ncbi:MAG TPA: AAA-like domain-containing protein [Acidobacteriaceae bacterium]
MKNLGTAELTAKAKYALEPLFTCTHDVVQEWEKGEYGVIYARPSKRVKAILDIQRELLCLVSSYTEQQARTIAFAKRIIAGSNGRLEQNVCLLVHREARGNSKLKKWGREQGLTVLPIYVSGNTVPGGNELEKALSFEFFSQDPFDITGPVASDAQFFGRRTEAQELARKLQNGQIRSCFGIRKIGKTSIMHRILHEIEDNFECKTIFADCQKDSIFSLSAPQLLMSFAKTIQKSSQSHSRVFEVVPHNQDVDLAQASQVFLDSVSSVDVPVVLAFDEVDYIAPGSPTAPHWKSDFIPFWRNVRAAYQSAGRAEKTLSIFVCGVSSKWFSVESIDGLENAALAFVPEEYLSPLPRGASAAMIRSVGPVAGLRFDESSAEFIAQNCSDMPFWIRKACSYIHERIDTAVRPIAVTREMVEPIVSSFVTAEGGSMAQVALQHLFRVYPDLRAPCLQLKEVEKVQANPSTLRVLCKYGLTHPDGRVSGEMMKAGIDLIEESSPSEVTQQAETVSANTLALELGDWAEELQLIGNRRNLIERKLREIVFNFVRMSALTSSTGQTAKDSILSALPDQRRKQLNAYSTDEISKKIYWLELSSIVKKNWPIFEKIFGDQAKLQANVELINDRPDAHAKEIDLADVALYRRALGWFEDCLAKVG